MRKCPKCQSECFEGQVECKAKGMIDEYTFKPDDVLYPYLDLHVAGEHYAFYCPECDEVFVSFKSHESFKQITPFDKIKKYK